MAARQSLELYPACAGRIADMAAFFHVGVGNSFGFL